MRASGAGSICRRHAVASPAQREGIAMTVAATPSTAPATFLPVRQDWLDGRHEAALDPALPIVDPHHHLWDRPGWRYLLPELLADTNTGHNIVATVYLQARAMHRADGPEELRP